MALDIGIGDGSSCCPLQDEPFLSFDDDGYYWFLHPLFEDLAATTGQYIDLYGNASFSNKDLFALKKMLTRARQLVKLQQDTWEVCIGRELVPHRKATRSRPHLKDVMSKVERHRFLLVLRQLGTVVARATELDKPVVCFGD